LLELDPTKANETLSEVGAPFNTNLIEGLQRGEHPAFNLPNRGIGHCHLQTAILPFSFWERREGLKRQGKALFERINFLVMGPFS